MKKYIALLMCLCLIVCQLSITAFAADATVSYDLTASRVSISGQSTAADDIDIVVFKTGDAMTPQNCIHLNQTECDENGNFSLDFVMPSAAVTAEYTIYISGADKVVFTKTFNHQNVNHIVTSLKNATTVADYKAVITANSNLFSNGFAAASDDVIALMLGEGFDTISGYENHFSKMSLLDSFKKADASGMKAIYDANSADLGMTIPAEYADFTEKTNVFAVAKQHGFNVKDVTTINDALKVGVVFTLIKEGGVVKLDTLVNYVKNNISLLGITQATADNAKLQEALRTMLGTSVSTTVDFATALNTAITNLSQQGGAVGNRPMGGGSTGGGGGGGGSTKPATGNIPLSVAPAAKPDKVEFTDLGSVSWAVEAINSLAERGIVSGVSATEFNPEANVTREQFVKMFVLALGIDTENSSSDFTDLAASHWSYSYVSGAVSAGIVNGIGGGSFGVGQNITREDMAVMLYRAASISRIALTEKTSVSFGDESSIADYAKAAVETMAKAGIINGSDGLFMPKANATRAQAAKMIYEILSLKEGA